MIVKTKSGYVVFSKEGKAYSKPYKSKVAAEKRQKEIIFYKNRNNGENR